MDRDSLSMLNFQMPNIQIIFRVKHHMSLANTVCKQIQNIHAAKIYAIQFNNPLNHNATWLTDQINENSYQAADMPHILLVMQ